MSPHSPHAAGRAALVLLMVLSAFTARDAAAQAQRMVVGSSVACRSEPRLDADVLLRLTVGDAVVARDSSGSGAEAWYLDATRTRGGVPGCWVHGSLLVDAADRHASLLAVADHTLARPNPALEEIVAAINLLERMRTRAHADSTVLATSPLLQLRRLELIEAATTAPGSDINAVRRDPLKDAWFTGRTELRYHEPAGGWVMPAESYWALHERNRSAPEAEEIAWRAARGAVLGDECDAGCYLSMLSRTYARYWALYPRGRWTGEALARGVRALTSAVEVGCEWDVEAVPARIAAVRSSLGEIPRDEGEPLLLLLARLEQKCGA